MAPPLAQGDWHNTRAFSRFTFHCGYCGDRVGAREGYTVREAHTLDVTQVRNPGLPAILICPTCNCPNFFTGIGWAFQSPSPMLGRDIKSLKDDIEHIYAEARASTKVGAYTACVLLCRKLLMHIAVEKGAQPGLGFVEYVDYLAAHHWVPPNGTAWVDQIRKKGNDANHKIVIMDQAAAAEILSFVEMLLIFMYEFPARLSPPIP